MSSNEIIGPGQHQPVEQIRRIFDDNLGIIFIISPHKYVVGTH